MASATSARPWPMLATIAPPAASRIRRPSSAISHAPSPSTIRGPLPSRNGQSSGRRPWPAMSIFGVQGKAERHRLLPDRHLRPDTYECRGLAIIVERVGDEDRGAIPAPVHSSSYVDGGIVAIGERGRVHQVGVLLPHPAEVHSQECAGVARQLVSVLAVNHTCHWSGSRKPVAHGRRNGWIDGDKMGVVHADRASERPFLGCPRLNL